MQISPRRRFRSLDVRHAWKVRYRSLPSFWIPGDTVTYGLTQCRSTIDYVWDKILMDSEISRRLADIFRPYLDPEDDLEGFQFTPLHQSVMKLTHIKLEHQLQISTADINTKCSTGKTPLAWAAGRSDHVSARLLLEYGAQPDSVWQENRSIVALATSAKGDDTETLKAILDSVSPSQQVVSRTALFCDQHIAPIHIENYLGVSAVH